MTGWSEEGKEGEKETEQERNGDREIGREEGIKGEGARDGERERVCREAESHKLRRQDVKSNKLPNDDEC